MSDTDSLYHRLFAHPLMVEHLVRAFVSEAMALGLDFEGMERVNAKFHARRSGQRREDDVIWRIPTQAGDAIYLYLIFEFQSSPDWWMAVRSLTYEGLLWEHVIAEKRLRPGQMLPPLLLLVLHNGETAWRAPTDTEALVDLPQGSDLWRWQPRGRYYLLDMGRFAEEDLRRREGLAALLFRLEQDHSRPQDLARLVADVIEWFRSHPDAEALRLLFADLVGGAIEGAGPAGGRMSVPDDLREMKAMLATQGERWATRWKAEGFKEGRAEGRADMLLLAIRSRFGDVPTSVEARLRQAGADELDGWMIRVLRAKTLDDVFGEG